MIDKFKTGNRTIMIYRLAMLAFLISGCQSEPNVSKDAVPPFYLRNLMDSVGAIQLPFKYNMVDEDKPPGYVLTAKPKDLLFSSYGGIVFGYLPDTSNFYGMLHLDIGDDFYPILSTYQKDGARIDRRSVGLGNCAGLGVDYEFCLEDLSIDEKLNISSSYCAKLLLESKEDYTIIDTLINEEHGKGRIDKQGKIWIKESGILEVNECSDNGE